jgi:hypothetical protein
MFAYDLIELLPGKVAFLFLVRTPLYAAFTHQKSPEFSVSVTDDFETHFFAADLQLGYFGELDSVLSHSGKYNASLTFAIHATVDVFLAHSLDQFQHPELLLRDVRQCDRQSDVLHVQNSKTPAHETAVR